MLDLGKFSRYLKNRHTIGRKLRTKSGNTNLRAYNNIISMINNIANLRRAFMNNGSLTRGLIVNTQDLTFTSQQMTIIGYSLTNFIKLRRIRRNNYDILILNINQSARDNRNINYNEAKVNLSTKRNSPTNIVTGYVISKNKMPTTKKRRRNFTITRTTRYDKAIGNRHIKKRMANVLPILSLLYDLRNAINIRNNTVLLSGPVLRNVTALVINRRYLMSMKDTTFLNQRRRNRLTDIKSLLRVNLRLFSDNQDLNSTRFLNSFLIPMRTNRQSAIQRYMRTTKASLAIKIRTMSLDLKVQRLPAMDVNMDIGISSIITTRYKISINSADSIQNIDDKSST